MYSCGSASETLQWINAIIEFIKPYLNSIINAHVVNFFNDKLWESIDQQWIHCLRHEPLQNLLLLPSGVFQDHWPPSLKEFVMSMRSLMFSREQVDLAKVLPGLNITSLNTVLSQGMNMKKKHEVEVLSAVVSSIANSVSAQTIVDVGAGQGYLAQVLSFQYNHSVVAIDASSHHGKVTDARAERIKKHYAAQMRKSGSGNSVPNVPKTITCRIMSNDMLKALTNMSVNVDEVEQPKLSKQDSDDKTSFVLAGLHACGDLSVTMLKTFLECKEVKAVVSIGCCYNLLSEECLDAADSHCGFPMSSGVKSAGISLGKNSRDLACQSADRWRSLDKDVGLQNFELHAFRAVFQMVLCRYYPDIIKESPSIGRQGKATRRQHQRRVLHSALRCGKNDLSTLPHSTSNLEESCLSIQPTEPKFDDNSASELGLDASLCKGIMRCKENASVDKYLLFEKFSFAGLSRLGLKPLPDIDFHEIWKEAEPFAELIGAYWSLRAAFGPILETLLLLDRLLFLQEQGSLLEAMMVPIFNPVLSPRNVAIIAKRT
ncbi:methyltransferase-like protein 25B isoform X1 [Ricinus communis]|uniref:methyltransferase-like protein 25B isoform X1 n=1 Tax=Ricinus communis TaxID=3988 RepID=UPI00201B29F3|nr:methyltransferase-like protein 25B isoform X1 [Ricinus communis]